MENVDIKKIEEYILNKDYKAISKCSFSIDVEELKKNKNIISWILKANLEVKDYNLNCFFIENLIRNNYESFEIYLYLFTSLMKINDYYRIKSYLVKSKFLNDTIIEPIFNGDLAVFSEIMKIDINDNENSYEFECALLLIVLDDLFNNYDIDSITNEEAMIAYYEMIDQAYSNGIEMEKMETIQYIANLLFENK